MALESQPVLGYEIEDLGKVRLLILIKYFASL